MSQWPAAHQQDAASRTRAILHHGHFSDVQVLVQGQVFHCHRYVLAQSSQFLFSRLLETRTASSQPPGRSGVPQLSSDGGVSSVSEVDVFCPTRVTVPEEDSYKKVHERDQEVAGIPTETSIQSTLGNTEAEEVSFESTVSDLQADSVNNSSSLRPAVPILAKSSSTSESSTSTLPRQQPSTTSQKAEEQSPQKPTLRFDFVSPQTFSAILEALYCGQDPVTPANVLDIFKASQRLHISSLLQYCEQFIIQLILHQKLDASEILYDTQMADNASILQSALEMLLTDFGPESSKADWFLKLPPEKLFSVLTDPRLNVRHEDEVYRALTDWYEHDPHGRDGSMATALTLLRLANLNKRILVAEILPHPLCFAHQRPQEGNAIGGRNDVGLAKLVRQALAYHLLPDRRHDELLPIADFRPSQDWERVLLVLGDQSAQLYAYSFARKAWFRLAPPPKALGLGVAACTHGDDLYVTGGDKATTACFRYRAEGNTWTQLSELNVGRRSHGCVAVEDNLYALGGKDDKQSFKNDTLDSVEIFHLRDKGQGWRLLTKGSLVTPVRSMTCVVHGDRIYVLGGRTNGFQQTVDAVQSFDTKTQQCSLVGHLPSPSCLARSFVVNSAIYILQPNGVLLRFHPPKNLLPEKVGDAFNKTPHPGQRKSSSPTHRPNHEPQQSPQHLDGEQQILQGALGSQEVAQNDLSSAEQLFTEVGQVHNLDWKWFGLARGHEGTLYVLAGECPPSFDASGLSGSGDAEVFRQVRFVRPEKMVLCYVSSHMCIPKSFLVEKIV